MHRRSPRAAAIAILLSLLAAPVWAGLEEASAPTRVGFEEGVAAYDRGDYATALREFRPLAERGYAEAQFNLGLMYDDGLGVPQDYVQAHMWLNLAASRFPPWGADQHIAVKYRDAVATHPASSAITRLATHMTNLSKTRPAPAGLFFAAVGQQ